MSFVLALLAALIQAPAATAAPPPAAAVEQGRSVAIPFDPPLGRRLRYRIVKVEQRRGVPQRIEHNMWVEFARSGDEFLVTTALVIPPELQNMHRNPLVAMLEEPTVIRVGPDGTVRAIENEAEYWTRAERMLDDLLPQLGLEPAQQRAIRAMALRLRDLPDAERLELSTQNVRPIFDLAGTEWTLGEVIEHRVRSETVVGPIEQDVRASLDRVEGGSAYVSSISSVPSDQVAALARRFGGLLASDRAARAAEAPMPPIGVRENVRVSMTTGLAERYELVRTILSDESEGTGRAGNSLVIERID